MLSGIETSLYVRAFLRTLKYEEDQMFKFYVYDAQGNILAGFMSSSSATRYVADATLSGFYMHPATDSAAIALESVLSDMRGEPQSRELSCAITRAEEALHWLQARKT